MKKLNCWEVKKCGRNEAEHGRTSCPVFGESRLHGVHGGRNAGRACWVVAGTRCDGKEQESFTEKHRDCEKCTFYCLVKQEEGNDFEPSILTYARFYLKNAGLNSFR